MAQSNENANGGGNTSPASGNGSGNAGTGAGTGEKKDRLMDIKKYLEKNKSKYGKSISGLLEVLFKDQVFNESEWAVKVQEAVDRQVK